MAGTKAHEPASPMQLAAATKELERASSKIKPGSGGYLIGPQDTLEVTVFKVQELSKTVLVAETGTVNLPLVGEVKAAGLTAQALEQDLTTRYGAKYLNKPQISVLIKEYNSQRVTVDGAIKKPGVFPLKGPTTLMHQLAAADGVNTDVSSNEVVIIRNKDGKRTAARFDLDEIKGGKVKDPALEAGDYVLVESSATKTALNNVLKAIPLASLFRVF